MIGSSRKPDWLALAGHLFFVFMAIMAVIFVRERIGTFDDAHYFIHISGKKTFFLPHDRLGAIPTQILPILFAKLGAGLKLTFSIYSLSHVFVAYLLWLFAHYIARQPVFAMGIVLIQLLLFKYLFFWPVSELQLASFYAVALLAWMASPRQMAGWVKYLVAGILVLLIVYTHPSGRILILAALVFSAFQKRRSEWKEAVLGTLGLIALMFLISGMKGYSAYETETVPPFEEMKKRFWLLGENETLHHLMQSLKGNLKVLSLFFLTSVLLAIWRRHWLNLLFVLGGVGGYIILLGIIYPFVPTNIVFENTLIPLGFFVTIVFLRETNGLRALGAVFVVFILILTWQMVNRVKDFQHSIDFRTSWIEQNLDYLDQFPERKGIVYFHNVPHTKLPPLWCFQFESIILKSLQSDAPCNVFAVAENPPAYMTETFQDRKIPGPDFWRGFSFGEFNEDYFHVATTNFRLMNDWECEVDSTKWLSDEWEKIDFEPSGHEILHPTRENQFSLTIHNQSDIYICSLVNKPSTLHLNYWFTNAEGEILAKKNPLIPIERDVPQGMKSTQFFWAFAPLPEGEYDLHIALMWGEKEVREQSFPVKIRK